MLVGSWVCRSEACERGEVRSQGIGLGIMHFYGIEGHGWAEIIQGMRMANPKQGSEDQALERFSVIKRARVLEAHGPGI